MRCPHCGRDARREETVYYRFRRLGMNEPVEMAALTCGCQVRAEDLARDTSDICGSDWETAVRRRLDENLRSIFG